MVKPFLLDRLRGKSVILISPPGGGKGEQTRNIECFVRRQLGPGSVNIFSPGSIFRQIQAKGGELGQRLDLYLNRGMLVPDDVMQQVLRSYANGLQDDQFMVFDGFPRSQMQVVMMRKVFPHHRLLALELQVPDKVCLKRLIHARRGRSDDTPKTIQDRLNLYREKLEGIKWVLAAEQIPLRNINGNRPPAVVTKEIFSVLCEWVMTPAERHQLPHPSPVAQIA